VLDGGAHRLNHGARAKHTGMVRRTSHRLNSAAVVAAIPAHTALHPACASEHLQRSCLQERATDMIARRARQSNFGIGLPASSDNGGLPKAETAV